MQVKKISLRDKIKNLIFSIFLICLLSFFSYSVDLNKKSQRFLEILFSFPSELINTAFENVREYENNKIFELENRILTLESDCCWASAAARVAVRPSATALIFDRAIGYPGGSGRLAGRRGLGPRA